jgi:hypothetical protein
MIVGEENHGFMKDHKGSLPFLEKTIVKNAFKID